MAKGMTAVDGLAERKVPPSCNGVVGSQLSKIPGVDAVFVYVDDDGLVHVYSVVPEFSFGLYKRLVKRERIIEEYDHVAWRQHELLGGGIGQV